MRWCVFLTGDRLHRVSGRHALSEQPVPGKASKSALGVHRVLQSLPKAEIAPKVGADKVLQFQEMYLLRQDAKSCLLGVFPTLAPRAWGVIHVVAFMKMDRGIGVLYHVT